MDFAISKQASQSRAVVSLRMGVLPPIVSQMTPWSLFEEEGMTDPLFLKGCVLSLSLSFNCSPPQPPQQNPASPFAHDGDPQGLGRVQGKCWVAWDEGREGEAECKVCLPPKPKAIPSVSSLRSLCRLMKCLSASMLHLTGMHTALCPGEFCSLRPEEVQLTIHSTCTGERWKKGKMRKRNGRREHRKQEERIWEANPVSPAGEPSDWAISAAMAEFGFSRFPNIWDGARLKDPGSEFA